MENLSAWSNLNNIRLNGVAVLPTSDDKGLGVVATVDLVDQDEILMTIPQELILSLENVWDLAKSDKHLHTVLEAMGEYSRVE